ncbi:MAG: hypothetical protein V1779_17745 [bacterium]
METETLTFFIVLILNSTIFAIAVVMLINDLTQHIDYIDMNKEVKVRIEIIVITVNIAVYFILLVYHMPNSNYY